MTKIINLYGGPGTGKSTTASLIYYILKSYDMNVELVSEFAKDLTWQNRKEELDCQFYVVGHQIYRIKSLIGKVSHIITDSPILLASAYCKPSETKLKEAIIEEHLKYDNIEIFLNRSKPYNPSGRSQNFDEAKQLDLKIRSLLIEHQISYIETNTDRNSIDETLKNINIFHSNNSPSPDIHNN